MQYVAQHRRYSTAQHGRRCFGAPPRAILGQMVPYPTAQRAGYLGHASLRVRTSLAWRSAFSAMSPPAVATVPSSSLRAVARSRQAAWEALAARRALAAASCRPTSAARLPSAARRRSTARTAAALCASMTLSARRIAVAAASRWSTRICCARAVSFAP